MGISSCKPERPQKEDIRLSELHTISGFRTVSDEAATVLAGMLPFFTGHGWYRKYLHRFRHEDTPECSTCPNLDEDSEHVLFKCLRYRDAVGTVSPPEGMVTFMLEGEDNWRNISHLIIGIQRDLRRCKKERRIMKIA
ncbi:uncharacterized protein LOC135426574 [Drosophila montana]|uniref:uncharacterized protein LOC135426574 n=1 Tax=Drosophila montana TaxID=40370 RepID=UPI00313C5899